MKNNDVYYIIIIIGKMEAALYVLYFDMYSLNVEWIKNTD